MSDRDNTDFLEDMLERINTINEFVKDGKQIFMQSRLIQDAVIRNLEIIGEASRNITDEFRQQYQEVPWRQIAAFRNFVIHVYWSINLERIWQIIENDLPPLKLQLTTILNDSSTTQDTNDLPPEKP